MKTQRTSIIASLIVALVLVGGAYMLGRSGDERGTSIAPVAQAASLEGAEVTVYRSPSCGCCGGHVDAMQAAGANVTVEMLNEVELQAVKERYQIPMNKQSCHTSVVDGYVVEGHVPIEALAQLRAERPDVRGVTLPGMPIGTPGMPGRQTMPYVVQTLDEGDIFWQKNPGEAGQSMMMSAGMMQMMVTSEREFIQRMIPHHEEAIATAKAVLERGGTMSEVVELMGGIIAAQTSEVEQMKAWHEAWYGAPYEDNGEYIPMMRDLGPLAGVDIDQAFMEDMIHHHMGAIMMARSIQPYLEHEEVATLAQNVITTQSAEIVLMRELLARL